MPRNFTSLKEVLRYLLAFDKDISKAQSTSSQIRLKLSCPIIEDVVYCFHKTLQISTMSFFRVSKREFNFKWCIEESLLNVEACLDSPIFLADSLMKTEWSLQLSIINVSHLRSLVCSLKRSDQDDGPNLIGVCFGFHWTISQRLHLMGHS
ncbi:hypothetical protein CEXT_383921 [Caerostris extrusa]|uniref:Uncharacterized protein n=1 Tax=Caerostris extrusa TaxID=172846 RepID=A0AAV4UJ40_CAEEX|nr:hypothetical protein CEXT_383921 [Caerostris extrusa]